MLWEPQAEKKLLRLRWISEFFLTSRLFGCCPWGPAEPSLLALVLKLRSVLFTSAIEWGSSIQATSRGWSKRSLAKKCSRRWYWIAFLRRSKACGCFRGPGRALVSVLLPMLREAIWILNAYTLKNYIAYVCWTPIRWYADQTLLNYAISNHKSFWFIRLPVLE
jgi:hypothetical protein